MHVHVVAPDGEAKFWLEPRVELAINVGLGQKVLRDARKVVEEHANEFKDAWRRYFG